MGRLGLADVASDPLKFVTFEGGDGAGKTTQLRRLADALSNSGSEVVVTREPGGTPAAEDLRALLVSGDVDRWDARSEALLHQAARIEHIRKTILPALDRGAWVLCDRFIDSTMAYQGYGHGLSLVELEQLQSFAVGDIKPGLTLVLDVPQTTGLARTGTRATNAKEPATGAEDRYERMSQGFRERVRGGFLEIARLNLERVIVVDATIDADGVYAACVDAFRERFGSDEPSGA